MGGKRQKRRYYVSRAQKRIRGMHGWVLMHTSGGRGGQVKVIAMQDSTLAYCRMARLPQPSTVMGWDGLGWAGSRLIRPGIGRPRMQLQASYSTRKTTCIYWEDEGERERREEKRRERVSSARTGANGRQKRTPGGSEEAGELFREWGALMRMWM